MKNICMATLVSLLLALPLFGQQASQTATRPRVLSKSELHVIKMVEKLNQAEAMADIKEVYVKQFRVSFAALKKALGMKKSVIVIEVLYERALEDLSIFEEAQNQEPAIQKELSHLMDTSLVELQIQGAGPVYRRIEAVNKRLSNLDKLPNFADVMQKAADIIKRESLPNKEDSQPKSDPESPIPVA